MVSHRRLSDSTNSFSPWPRDEPGIALARAARLASALTACLFVRSANALVDCTALSDPHRVASFLKLRFLEGGRVQQTFSRTWSGGGRGPPPHQLNLPFSGRTPASRNVNTVAASGRSRVPIDRPQPSRSCHMNAPVERRMNRKIPKPSKSTTPCVFRKLPVLREEGRVRRWLPCHSPETARLKTAMEKPPVALALDRENQHAARHHRDPGPFAQARPLAEEGEGEHRDQH